MKSITLLMLALLVVSTGLVYASPIQKARPAAAGITLPVSPSIGVSQGYLPKPPAGFHTKITYTDAAPINPTSIYLMAIGYLYGNAQTNWHALAGQHKPYTSQKHNVAIFVHNPARPGGSILEQGHVMRGVYDGVVAMFEDRRFQSVAIAMFIFDQPIGEVVITRWFQSTGSSSNASMIARGDADALESEGLNNSSIQSSGDDHGRYIDRVTNHMSIVYNWNTPRINGNDIFTVLMEGIMIIHHDGAFLPFDHLNAVSATGRCAMNIHEIGPDKSRIRGISAATFIFLLATMIVEQRRFENLDFSLDWQVAGADNWQPQMQGYIMGLEPPQAYSPGVEIVAE